MMPNLPHSLHLTPLTVVGRMSGTSADGIDAAVVEISGRPPELNWRLLAQSETSYSDELSERVFAALRPQTATVDQLCSLNFALGEALAEATLQAIREAGLAEAIALAVFAYRTWHGRPSNLPSANGATRAVPLGTITPGRLWPNRESRSSPTL